MFGLQRNRMENKRVQIEVLPILRREDGRKCWLILVESWLTFSQTITVNMTMIKVMIMNRTYYETGIEIPEILGSGSQVSNIMTTANEEEAFRAYHIGDRNYLYRITHCPGKPRIIEWWSEWEKCWRI